MKLLGITGLIGSGKDTLADYLMNDHGFSRDSFAGPLKDAVAAVFGWDRTLLEGRTSESREWREKVDEWWAKKLDMPDLTPRWVLQYWGTEVFRKGFHDNIWVASLEYKISKLQRNTVITDVRFVNEIQAIKNQGGVCIRIVRGPEPSWMNSAVQYMSEPINSIAYSNAQAVLVRHRIHASEYSWAAVKFDHIVYNNGSIDELHSQIKELL